MGKAVEQQELSFTAGGKAQCVQALWVAGWQFLPKSNILAHGPAITLLGTHPKELRIYSL